MFNTPSQIAIVHQNSLCCLAMRAILADILPFMGAMSNIEIASYNSIKEANASSNGNIFLYFVSREIVSENMEFFLPLARRTIILNEGEELLHNDFKHINILQSEQDVIKSFLAIHNHAHAIRHHSPECNNAKSEELSQREKEVLALIVKGFINKEIADTLNISTSTVIFHRKNICERIGSKSIGRLTIYAVMNGIVDLREI